MQSLDGKDHRRGRYEKFFEELIVALLNGTERRLSVLELVYAQAPLSVEELAAANAIFQSRLRTLVDEWIQTGVDTNGIETPSNRRVRASVDEPPISIFDVLLEWLGRNMPKPALTNDGTIAILEMRPRFDGKSPEQYARDIAIYYFQQILASPSWTRIGKCANSECGQYFLRQRGRKNPIKRGSYCGSCKLIGAAERTKRSRRERKLQMLRVAAQAWNASSKRRVRTDRAKWIAAQVNKKFGKIQFVHPKWVNQNRAEIQALAMKGSPSHSS